MSEYRSILERAREQFPAPDIPLEGVLLRRDRRLRNRRFATAVLALVLAAAAIGGLVRVFYRAERLQPADKTRIVGIPIDLGANYVAVGEGSVWVSGEDGVSRVDPVTNQVIASFPGRTSPVTGTSIAVGEGAVWAIDGRSRGGATSIVRIDPVANEVVATIRPNLESRMPGRGGGPGLWGITTGLGSVWVGSHFGGALLRLDPATDEIDAISVPRPVVHVGAVLDGMVWIAATDADMGGCGGRDALIAIDPASGEVVVDGSAMVCDEVRAGFGSLWTSPSGWLIRIDPSNRSAIASIRLPCCATAAGTEVAVGEDAVWVADEGGRVVRIDPETNEVVGELDLGAPVRGIAAGEGGVWVTDGVGTLYRIDPEAVTRAS